MPPVDVVVLGVASSAGTHHAGQDRAPAALRQAGFLDRLRAAGLSVHDGGDIVTEIFAADHAHPAERNLAAVVRVARVVADAVAEVADRGSIPLVIGGDCTITLGVVAGVQRRRPQVGLFYFDGDADLGSPDNPGTGILDAVGVAHLLGLVDNDLATLTGATPMLSERRLVLVGYDDTDPIHQTRLRQRPALTRFTDRQVRQDPAGCATTAVRALQQTGEGIVVHFDVDAVDSGDLPLANFPHYGTGVTLDDAGQVLAVATAAPDLAAIVLTEVNPSYEPSGNQLARYVHVVADAIAAGLAPPRSESSSI